MEEILRDERNAIEVTRPKCGKAETPVGEIFSSAASHKDVHERGTFVLFSLLPACGGRSLAMRMLRGIQVEGLIVYFLFHWQYQNIFYFEQMVCIFAQRWRLQSNFEIKPWIWHSTLFLYILISSQLYEHVGLLIFENRKVNFRFLQDVRYK